MNRAQRRAQAKATPAYRRGMTEEDRLKAYCKNGITIADLDKAGKDGYAQGWRDACQYCMRVCYAASVRALHQMEGYGTKRNRRFLMAMDDIVTNSLTSEEAIEAALQEAGVAINFREPFPEDRIQEV